MKRLLEDSPVVGYQLFRYAYRKQDGSTGIVPTYYVRHNHRDISTGTDRLKDAKFAVRKLAGADLQRRKHAVAPDQVTVGTLLDLVIDDYKANDLKTLKHASAQIKHSLRPFFGNLLAARVHTPDIERWIAWRETHRLRKSSKLEHAKLMPATINRELALLRRAYQLGYERNPQLVEKIPPIKKLAENNVRKGFVTPEQYRKLMEELPAHLKPITCVAFHIANRKGELLNLEWSDVELTGNPPLITLWPGETKNRDGRTLPILTGEMLDTLRALKAEHDRNWPKQAHVFLNEDGTPLQYHHMRQVWNDACTRANLPGLLFHDLRRSAVRNLRRAGVTQAVARQFSGHKTDSVFNRYNITDFEDLKDAAARLQQFLKEDGRDK